jgi:hypothetical protein
MTQSGSAAEGAAEGILRVPGGVLLSVLDGLSAVELIRIVALTSRTLTEILTGEGRSQDLWGQAILLRLQRFMPARRFFAEHFGRQPAYAPYKLTCDARLGEALARAGLDVTWDERGRALVPPIPTVLSEANFATWAQAFACEACGEAGAARRQCAGCGELLCITCAHRCAHDSRCGFALCGDCHAENSIHDRVAEAETVWDMEEPGLLPPPCGECPFSLQCPAHAAEAILMCQKCAFTACSSHPYSATSKTVMQVCHTCFSIECTGCSNFMICLDCYETTCGKCQAKPGGDTGFFHFCSGCLHMSCGKCQRKKGAAPVYCMECFDSLCDGCVRAGKGTILFCMKCFHSVCDKCQVSRGRPFDFCRRCYLPHCAGCLPASGLCDRCK